MSRACQDHQQPQPGLTHGAARTRVRQTTNEEGPTTRRGLKKEKEEEKGGDDGERRQIAQDGRMRQGRRCCTETRGRRQPCRGGNGTGWSEPVEKRFCNRRVTRSCNCVTGVSVTGVTGNPVTGLPNQWQPCHRSVNHSGTRRLWQPSHRC